MKILDKLIGAILSVAMLSSIGIATLSTNNLFRANADNFYSTKVNAKVEVDETVKTLGYNTTGSYMVDSDPDFFTISWSSSNTHFTLKWNDTNLGVKNANTFGTSATLWTIKNDCIYANDGTNDREIQWNTASSGLRAAPYKHNESYPAVYLYTAAELDSWCERCNGTQFAFECLYNLLTIEEKSKFNVEGTGYTLPEEQQEETGTEITISPSDGSAIENSDYTITKTPITINVNSSTLTSEQIRVFKGKTITISGAIIVKVIFTCTAQNTNKYGPGCFTTTSGYTYSGYTGTWTGNASSVVFTASTNQVRITQIVITYK